MCPVASTTNQNDPSLAFLRDTAAKHSVCLSYREKILSSAATEEKLLHASCFVVETEGHWLLVTAGHIISDIVAAISKGASFYDFNIHDKLAGNDFPFGVPYHFEISDWVVIEQGDDGADFAA